MNRDALVSWLATLPLTANSETNHTQLDPALTAAAVPLPETDIPYHFHKHMGLISHVCDSQDPLIINRMLEALDPPDEWMKQCRSHHLSGSPLSVGNGQSAERGTVSGSERSFARLDMAFT